MLAYRDPAIYGPLKAGISVHRRGDRDQDSNIAIFENWTVIPNPITTKIYKAGSHALMLYLNNFFALTLISYNPQP